MEDAMGLHSIARELEALTGECRELDARVGATSSTLPHDVRASAASEVRALLARLDVLAAEVGQYQADVQAFGLDDAAYESAG
jgi:hypothetical protein